MKRVAFLGIGVIRTKESRGIPGLENLLKLLASDFEIVFYRLNSGIPAAPARNIRYRSVPGFSLPHKISYLVIILRFLADHFSSRFSLINALAATPSGRIAVFLGKLLHIPVIVHLHASETVAIPEISHGDFLNPALKKITQRVCAQTDCLTVLSEYQHQIVNHALPLAKRCEVIPQGIDLNLFSPDHRPHSELVLLFVGYNEPVKNPAGALKAFVQISKQLDSRIIFVGGGLQKSELASDIPAYLVNKVTFLGDVPHEKMPEVFAGADVLIVTSRYESQSFAALEAMAAGVLVCGTSVGILSDLSGKACLTVAPGNEAELSTLIVNLHADRDKQEQLRAMAFQWVRTHDLYWTARKYKALFNSIIKKDEPVAI